MRKDRVSSREFKSLWAERIEALGMPGLVEALTVVFSPFRPVAAQFLWFIQPGFALFGHAEEVGQIAETFYSDEAEKN